MNNRNKPFRYVAKLTSRLGIGLSAGTLILASFNVTANEGLADTQAQCVTFPSSFTTLNLDKSGAVKSETVTMRQYDPSTHTLIETNCFGDCGTPQAGNIRYRNDDDFIKERLSRGYTLAQSFESNGYKEQYLHDDQGRLVAIKSTADENTTFQLTVLGHDELGRELGTEMFDAKGNSMWSNTVRFDDEHKQEYRHTIYASGQEHFSLNSFNDKGLELESRDPNTGVITRKSKPESVTYTTFCKP